MDVTVQINTPVLSSGQYFEVRYRPLPNGNWIGLPDQSNAPFVIPNVPPGDYELEIVVVLRDGTRCPAVIKKFTVPGCDPDKTVPATTSQINIYAVTDLYYGYYGAYVYNPGFSVDGTATIAAHMTNAFWKSKINDIAVWTSLNGTPYNTWIGFNFCFTLAASKTYYIAIAADNRFKLNIDGTDILVIDGTMTAVSVLNTTTNQNQLLNRCQALGKQSGAIPPPYTTGNISGNVYSLASIPNEALHIFPVTLAAGSHTLKIQAMNVDAPSPGAIACEIYDNLLADLTSASSNGKLNIVFTTKGQRSFNSGVWTCPDGYELVDSGTCEAPHCKQICDPPPPDPEACECGTISQLYLQRNCDQTATIHAAFDLNSFEGACSYTITYTHDNATNQTSVPYPTLPASIDIPIPDSGTSMTNVWFGLKITCCTGEEKTCFWGKIIDVRDCQCISGPVIVAAGLIYDAGTNTYKLWINFNPSVANAYPYTITYQQQNTTSTAPIETQVVNQTGYMEFSITPQAYTGVLRYKVTVTNRCGNTEGYAELGGCGAEISYNGGPNFPTELTVYLGPETGKFCFSFNPMIKPDKMIVIFDGIEVINTGYLGDPSFQSSLDTMLTTFYGLPPETIVGTGPVVVSFNKNTATQYATIKIYAPLQ